MKNVALICIVFVAVALGCKKKNKNDTQPAPESKPIAAEGTTSAVNGNTQFQSTDGQFVFTISPSSVMVNQPFTVTTTCPGTISVDLGSGVTKTEASFSHSITTVGVHSVTAYCSHNGVTTFRQETVSVLETIGTSNGKTPNNPHQN